jgi:putative transposase
VIANPRHLKRRLKKLKRLQRVVIRRHKGGKNRKKAVRKLAKLHRRIRNQRSNTLHQVTTRLAKTKSVLVIEDLHVAGMLKNHRLAQAIGDVGFLSSSGACSTKPASMGQSDPGRSLGTLQPARKLQSANLDLTLSMIRMLQKVPAQV